MTQPDKPEGGSPPIREKRTGLDRQETVLLTDLPDPNQTAPATHSSVNPTLTTVAALSERYDLLGEAGHGSMGIVYKARDRETGETVALKLLKPEIASDQSMMERFKRELLFARKITHKNVCRVHEFNRVGSIAYTSMEYVEGESLRSVLNRVHPLPREKGLQIALQICAGLKEAHAQGIVHRDLKPENVMLDAQGNVKIMDFGIARSMEAGTRLTGSLVGTPAYMAPEQVAGKPVDYRTDIYSVGLILYEMFSGAPAFQADTPVAVALKQMRESPPLPREVDPSIPAGLERAILKCLEKEPERRFASVAELEAVLRAPSLPTAMVPAAPMRDIKPPTAISMPRVVPIARQRPRSGARPLVWILLVLGLATVVFAGLHANALQKAAALIPPPEPAFPAPTPPEFALHVTPASSVKRSVAPLAKKPASPPSASRRERPSTPKAEVASKPNSSRPPQRAATPKPNPQEGSVAQEGRLTYLWVGRFAREDRAQKAAKKIEDLGLPVYIVPRHGVEGQFWLVFAGPFGAKRAWSVAEWLEAQGFSNVHPVQVPPVLR